MHWSRRGVPRVDGRVIPWIRVLAKFINDLRGDEHRPSGLPCVAHPSSDWSLIALSASCTPADLPPNCQITVALREESKKGHSTPHDNERRNEHTLPFPCGPLCPFLTSRRTKNCDSRGIVNVSRSRFRCCCCFDMHDPAITHSRDFAERLARTMVIFGCPSWEKSTM